MKVACVYHPRLTSGWGKFHFVADAFERIGCEVERLCSTESRQAMAEVRAADGRCDLVLYEQRVPGSVCDVDLVEFLPHRKAVHCQWYFDLNFFSDVALLHQEAFAPFLRVARGMDIVFVKERGRLDDYKAAGVNAAWLDQGCPSTMPQATLVEDPPFDVVLWGSSRRSLWSQRCEDVHVLMQAGFKVAWAAYPGEGRLPDGVAQLPPVQPLDLYQIVEMGKVSLVVDARQDIDGYWSDRIWLASGAGSCIVRRMNTGGGHLPGFGYASHTVLLRIVGELCNEEGGYRKRIAHGAFSRERTMLCHSYESRAREILSHVESIREQKPAGARLQAV